MRLKLYNGALRELGERRLSSLSEEVPARYDLDEVWDNGFIRDALERGLWNFAARTSELNYTGDINPEFGYRYAFEKPVDWVRTAKLCTDEWFRNPLRMVEDQQNYWFCDLDKIYVSYISDDDAYGSDFGLWPVSFTRWAEAYLAFKIAPRVAPKKEKDAFDKQKKFLTEARSRDAMNDASGVLPEGSWTRSRRARRNFERTGNQLIG